MTFSLTALNYVISGRIKENINILYFYSFIPNIKYYNFLKEEVYIPPVG